MPPSILNTNINIRNNIEEFWEGIFTSQSHIDNVSKALFIREWQWSSSSPIKKYFVDSNDYLVQQDAYLDPGLPWNNVWPSPA